MTETVTFEIEVPKKLLDKAGEHISVVVEAPSNRTASNYREWFEASCGPEEVWMLVRVDTGNVREQHTLLK